MPLLKVLNKSYEIILPPGKHITELILLSSPSSLPQVDYILIKLIAGLFPEEICEEIIYDVLWILLIIVIV